MVDADGAAEVENACSHPLLEAKTPRELALLVKHYRLLQVRWGFGGRHRGIKLPVSSALLAGLTEMFVLRFACLRGEDMGGTHMISLGR